jgi:hypothetical protein
MTAGQVNEPIQETAGGFADTAADAPEPKLSLQGKSGSWPGWFVSNQTRPLAI